MRERPLKERRVVLFVLAGVLVVVAVGLVLYYVNTADDRAERDVEDVDVLVAVEPIAAGTTGQEAIDQDWIQFEPRPRNTVPDNIVRDASELSELVAPANISAKDFITTDRFVSEGQAATGGALIAQIPQDGDPDPSDRQAVAISLDAEKTVANNVLPGDVVNVIATVTTPEGDAVSAFLIEKAPVIGVPPPTTPEGETAEASGGTVILSITPDEVLQVVTAKNAGMVIWMTLVPRDYEANLPGPAVSNAPSAPEPIFG